jgi:hypothetical protein
MELYPQDVPSMNNIYESKYWDKVRKDEQSRSDKMYEKSKSPFETGIVATPAYASMFQTLSDDNDNLLSNDIVPSLSGNNISIENFTHNNMQPFFKGNITQNVDLDKTSARVDINTGNNKFYQNKKEVECFFKPTSGYGNVCSMKNHDDYYKDHIQQSKLQRNVFPIESVKVGPGLNKGYTSYGSGGFQQSDSLEYSKPKTLDDLRSKINQKSNHFEVPFQAPVKGTDQRGVVTPFLKQKPEKTYEKTPEQWFKTTGANLKSSERPEQYIKTTSRIDSHIDYKGGARLAMIKGKGEKDDYGKENIMVYSNERQFTETKTVVCNATSIVKSIVAPVLDALKFTIKEYTIDSARATGGNIRTQIPEKATLYDPINHVMRTTVKETTIHDSELNNLSGPDGTYSALHDIAKTTVKETTIHDAEINNLSGPDGTYSALEDIAKTTVKETTIHDAVVNNIKGNTSGYINSDDNAKTTVRETLPVQDTTRNIGAKKYKVYVYDPDLVVKTTVKETTIKGKSEYGFIGGILNGLIGGYISTPVELKNTQKQFTSDISEYGVAKSAQDHRQMSREADYNAEIDETREKILIAAGHTPNAGNMGKISADKDNLNMTTKKQVENSIAARNAGNISKIYQTSPVPIEQCSITRPQVLNNAFENRLDSSLLESLKTNEFDIRINPIKSN